MSDDDKKLNHLQGGENANLDDVKGASNLNLDDGGENANISEEKYNEALNRAKGLDSSVSKLQKKLEALMANQEAEKLKGMTAEEQAKQLQAENLALKKKEKFRSLCAEKGLNANEFMETALDMNINNLENFVNLISNNIESTAQATVKKILEDKQRNADYIKPTGESKNLTEKDELEARLKAKGLI